MPVLRVRRNFLHDELQAAILVKTRLYLPFGKDADKDAIRDFLAGSGASVRQAAVPISITQNDSGSLRVFVDSLSLEQLYYREDARGIELSRDARSLHRPDDESDLGAVFSLLQYGMIAPPRSPWKDVRRFTPGFSYELGLAANESTVSVVEIGSDASGVLFESNETSEDDMCQRLVGELDRVIEESCPSKDPVILFSGGVDSALLASRAVALGWSGTTLVNYCLGPEDTESRFAEQVAKHWGLEFVRIQDEGRLDRKTLTGIAKDYGTPFGDYSVLPTHRLTRGVQARFGSRRVVFDGTGADASFGLFEKAAACKKLYRLPHWIRESVASLYRMQRVWSRPSRLEFFLRMCRRTSQMAPAAASIARNPLSGVAFRFRNEDVASVGNDITNWLDGVGIPTDLMVRLPMIDLILGTANIFAQKNASLFSDVEQHIVYPFMDRRVAMLAVSNPYWIEANRQPKAILKKILAADLPSSMVYRTKRGFTVPGRVYFGQADYVDFFDQAISSQVLHAEDWGIRRNLAVLRERLARQLPMPEHNYHFVWNVVFLYAWLLGCDA